MTQFWEQKKGQKVQDYLNYIQKQVEYGYHYGCQASPKGCHKRSHGTNWNHYCCEGRWLREGLLTPIFNELIPEIRENRFNMKAQDYFDAVFDAEYLWSLKFRNKHYIGQEVPKYNGCGFNVDRDGHVIVYTDGACPRNGQPGAQGGIGVWFGQNHSK